MPAPEDTELLILLSTGLALVEPDGRMQWLNPALGEMLDVGSRTAVGQNLSALLRYPALLPHLARTLSEGRAFYLRGTAFHVGRGRDLVADVTMQPVAEERVLVEVHPLTPDLTPAATPLSATLRGLAHEVKNPLAGLRGAAQQISTERGGHPGFRSS
ncbi:hypothetical protein [Luteibacter sp. SG786]|uniref:hypothetical protein n=1 Tax=Luteibacter sp. SG786 TaxID=2587130 RepID=UPI001422BC7A|nr:hypothetical protein [Luteibacter sp. SG786]NII55823.1 nitrogen-specific signal transduction histidine kinase [Luteibacter sp. SG786]